MVYRRIWIIAIVAALFSWFLLLGNDHYKSIGASYNSVTLNMSTGWTISDGERNIFKNSAFLMAGRLKKQHKVILTKQLPETAGQSICFTTIGYTVKAFIDRQNIYSFGSSPDGNDVWGTKTHLIRIPDGGRGRTLRFEFVTDHPANIAVSKHVLLDKVLPITNALLKSSLIELCFSLLYISIGVFILMYWIISLAFKLKGFEPSLLMLALIALFMGSRILFNISFITLHTGPEFVYWSTNLLNLAIPIPALLFAAADKGFQKSGLFIGMAAVQSAFLLMWVICKFLNLDIFLLYWHVPLFILITAIFTVTFISEFLTGTGRPELAVAVLAILVGAVVDAQIYFYHGNYYSMDYNLTIYTFPVLVLLTSKVVLDSIRREFQIINDNTTLRVEGELLFENYNRLNQYIEETKKIWHDIDKHYFIISRMAADGEYDELKSYLKYIGQDMKETKSSYLCDNRLINVILTDKLAEAKNAGIRINFSGNLPTNLNIQGNDLCSLLVNLLDNAIEACEKILTGSEKRIELSLKMKQGFVYFEVLNTVDLTQVIMEKTPVTSKEDKERHGYGLAIVRKITEKYDGAFDIVPLENSFMIKVALKNAPVGGAQQIAKLKTGTVWEDR